jgi:archaemetzincin
MPPCKHHALHLDVSPHAAEAGFARPPLAKRKAATTLSGRATGSTEEHARLESLFPGPLVLPDDGLAIDPNEPPQSLRSWTMEKMRNPVTNRRKTIYVVPAPEIPQSPAFCPMMNKWKVPSALPAPLKGGCDAPRADHVRDYLEAFYHPLPVKILPGQAQFVPWTNDKSKTGISESPQYIGLQLGDSVTRITTRPCPDEVYPRQLGLNGVLDAAIQALPDDAYAMVVLTDHDLYEDEDDDFCCGRAYGSSRVAVVSSARYHPLLDKTMGIDREHMWPFSHCDAYVQRLCKDAAGSTSGPTKRRKLTTAPDPAALESQHPIARVIQAGLAWRKPSTDRQTILWLSRMVRTVSHEVGHCVCLAHCSYYACVMQGTAGIAEDLRQPPYLCLVCEAKLARAVRDIGEADEVRWLIERYTLLVGFCTTWERGSMFAAYRCWLEQRIAVLIGTLPRAAKRSCQR